MSDGDDGTLQFQGHWVYDRFLLMHLILAPILSLCSMTFKGFFNPKGHRSQSLPSFLQRLYNLSLLPFLSTGRALVGTSLTGTLRTERIGDATEVQVSLAKHPVASIFSEATSSEVAS